MDDGKDAFLRVQLNKIDFYQCKPSKWDRRVFEHGTTRQIYAHVPIIRVFGRTDTGRNILVHMHGVYPYIYIEYDGHPDQVNDYIERLYNEINHVMRQVFHDNDPDAAYVASIVVCKGVPFYGYHVGWRLFLKIYLLNPHHLLKLADLFRNNAILGKFTQPYESHIPYVSQFLADFNLFGCGWMNLSDACYRQAGFKTAVCDLEVDVTADKITNRLDIQQDCKNSLFSKQLSDEPATQLTNLQELWQEDVERRAMLGAKLFEPPRPTQRAPENFKWYRQGEHEKKFEQLATGKFAQDFAEYPDIPTVFQSVNTMLRPSSESSGDVSSGPTASQEQELDEFSESNSDSENYDADVNTNEPDTSIDQSPSIKRSSSSFNGKDSAKRLKAQSFLSFLNVSQSSKETKTSFGSMKEVSFRNVVKKFGLQNNTLGYRAAPPTKKHVVKTMDRYGPSKTYQDPYYSNESDIPDIAVKHAGVQYRIVSNTVPYLPDFWYPPANVEPNARTVKVMQYLPKPPSRSEIQASLEQSSSSTPSSAAESTIRQIPTTNHAHGVGGHDHDHGDHHHTRNYMNVLTVEVHANCEPGKLPNPKNDPIRAVFWRMLYDETFDSSSKCGIIVQGDNTFLRRLELISKWDVANTYSEYQLLRSLIQMVRYFDPDILAGYEIQKSSWGYLIDRAAVHNLDLMNELSRVKTTVINKRDNQWGLRHTTDINIVGRYMLNIWRVVRKEIALTQYTLENVVWISFGERIPHYTSTTLARLWNSDEGGMDLAQALKYYTSRLDYDVRIIEKQELVGRYSEQARIIGIDYNSVHYRGSQFQVESFLSRLTKKENFVMVSPSKKQVGEQNALEFIPLVMEPESEFYTSPVLVLDFQSLYPSIMIAYNYCYSTCLGRIIPWRGRNKMGFRDLDLPEGLLAEIKDQVTIAPNGMIYTKPSVRKSLLATMLTNLLDTRVMVKEGMKFQKDNVAFQKSMNNRQLALKLIANVTYGYTSASYSGRMPCTEIADSIVLSGRETLERAINVIQTTEKWGADVIYGDTDSIFVHLPGKTREQAFDIGEDISRTITKQNPEPVKLKFEKVYHPCILQTKKRYVGYMYEHRDQREPVFDAKGTETVRRDGTPIEQKIEEKALRIIFETSDLSKVKSYLVDEWSKIMSGDVSIQDFCFAKEVKLGTYRTNVVPGAAVSAKKMAKDERAEPEYRERVPYVVVSGARNDRLVDRCVSPDTLLHDPSLHLDARYYITKNLIPPLERMFNMMGANIRQWYEDMAKPHFSSSGNLNNYMRSLNCWLCGAKTDAPGGSRSNRHSICFDCRSDPDAIYTLQMRRRGKESRAMTLEKMCRSCSGVLPARGIECVSGDCPVYYARVRTNAELVENVSIEW